MRSCSICNAEGWVLMKVKPTSKKLTLFPCPKCLQTGEVDEWECGECRGSGILNSFKCQWCKGSGHRQGAPVGWSKSKLETRPRPEPPKKKPKVEEGQPGDGSRWEDI